MRRILTLATIAVLAGCATAPAAAPSTTAPGTATGAPVAASTAVATATPPPRTTAPLPAFEDGRFTGTWANTTFGSTGPATFEVKVDRAAATIAVTIALGGNVFGAPAPAPETFTLPIGAAGATFTGTSKTFGEVTAAVKDGTIAFKGDRMPSTRVKSIEGNGTYTTTAISLAYTVVLADGTAAKGTVTLRKA